MEKITIDCIIGIDPGKSGGLAIWRPNYKTEVLKMPSNILDLRQYFEYIASICNPLIFLEKVQLRPDDIKDNPGKAFRIQRMLADFETLKTVISVCDIPFVLVNPMKWQNTLKVRVKGEERKDRKKRFQRAAIDCYPDVKVTLWNCDALLLLHFGRFVLQNDFKWVLQNLPNQIHYKIFDAKK